MRLLALLLLCTCVFAEGPVKGERIEVELVAEHKSVQPGSTLTVGLRVKPDEHWHIYWVNPGDAGLEPALTWTLPAGLRAGPIEWPFPKTFLMPGPVMNYVIEGEVVLPVKIEVPYGIAGPVKLAVTADWLVCDDKQCIPGRAELELTLPVDNAEPQADARWTALFDKARKNRPQPLPRDALEATRDGDEIRLRLAGVSAKQAYFFPYKDQLEHSEPQEFDGHVLALPAARELKHIKGVLVLEYRIAYEVDLPVEAPAAFSPDVTLLLLPVAILVVFGVARLLRRS